VAGRDVHALHDDLAALGHGGNHLALDALVLAGQDVTTSSFLTLSFFIFLYP
jgi:hypothetical protein